MAQLFTGDPSGAQGERTGSLGLQPTKRQTAMEVVRDTLRLAIITARIPAGTRLVQAEVAGQLGVSTTPVREAFRSLAAEGLIRLDTHRGALVNRLSPADMEDVHRLRWLLEPEALRRAAPRITDADLERAARIEVEMSAESDPALWSQLNGRFHQVFVQAAGSERLTQFLKSLQDGFAMYIVASHFMDDSRRAIANAQHKDLLAAMRTRDANRAVSVMYDHMRETFDHVGHMPHFHEPEASLDAVPGTDGEAG